MVRGAGRCGVRSKTCGVCGYDHARLGIAFRGRTLHRQVQGSRHRVRSVGGAGAFAFAARLWDRHAGTFDRVLIRDLVSGDVFYGDPKALERIERRTLSAEYGEQVLLKIDDLQRTRSKPMRLASPSAPVPEPITAPAPTEDCSAQPALF